MNESKFELIIEKLAEYSHKAWSEWMKYFFSKCIKMPNGSYGIPTELVERWQRQMNTTYQDLPEQEKSSDRDQAQKIVDALIR